MEKSILNMVGGEKHIKPNYKIKEESEGFTGIEVNGVRFSNLGEMLCYMNKQKEQIIKAKELLLKFIELKNKPCAVEHSVNMLLYDNICVETKQFLKEVSE